MCVGVAVLVLVVLDCGNFLTFLQYEHTSCFVTMGISDGKKVGPVKIKTNPTSPKDYVDQTARLKTEKISDESSSTDISVAKGKPISKTVSRAQIKTEMTTDDRCSAKVSVDQTLRMETELSSNVPSNTKLSVGLCEIRKAIADFKGSVPWPTEKQAMPSFTDETATIYLQFQTKKAKGPATNCFLGKVVLPHFLSTKRSLCVVARDMSNEEKRNKMITLLRELGVVGEIKTMPLSELQALLRAEDKEEVNKFVQQYDTHLCESYGRQKIGRKIAPYMDKFSKSFNWFDFGLMEVPQRFGEETLGKADLFVSPSSEGYIVKVGHTGFTDDQLVDNIRAALEKIDFWTSIFPGGLKHFMAVNLKTGITDGVPIFVNSGEIMDEPPRRIREEEQKGKLATKAASKKGNRKRKTKPSNGPFEKKLHLMDL